MRKLLALGTDVLSVTGLQIVLGCMVAWYFGMKSLSDLYEKTGPLLWLFLAGLGLLLPSVLLSLARGANAAAPGRRTTPCPAPEGKIECGKCDARNGEHARFCDQCGAPLCLTVPATGIKRADEGRQSFARQESPW